MRTLVVYYSLSGNTARAAERIAKTLGAELLALEPVKPYPARGPAKFLAGGRSALREETPPLKPCDFRPEEYEQVVFGFPVWASNVAPPLRSFVSANREALKGKSLAAFACQAGSGGDKALEKLLDCLGAEAFRARLILTDPKKNGADGREAQLTAFCEQLR